MKKRLTLKKTSHYPVNREALDLFEEGLVDLDRNRLDIAKSKFEAAIALEPEFAVAHFYLGSVLFEQELAAEAITAFERALTIDPYNDELKDLIFGIKDLSDNT